MGSITHILWLKSDWPLLITLKNLIENLLEIQVHAATHCAYGNKWQTSEEPEM